MNTERNLSFVEKVGIRTTYELSKLPPYALASVTLWKALDPYVIITPLHVILGLSLATASEVLGSWYRHRVADNTRARGLILEPKSQDQADKPPPTLPPSGPTGGTF